MVRIGRYDPTATAVFLALTLLIAHTLYFSAWKETHGQAPDNDPFLPRLVRSEDERYARALTMLYAGGCTFITLIALIARTGVGGGGMTTGTPAGRQIGPQRERYARRGSV